MMAPQQYGCPDGEPRLLLLQRVQFSADFLMVSSNYYMENVLFFEDCLAGYIQLVRVLPQVLLAGGAISSPQVLMLSGVGPAEHLRSKVRYIANA